MSQQVELPTLNARKSIGLVFVGMALYLIYLYHLGLSEILATLQSVNPYVFALGFGLALLGVLFDGLAWKRVAIKFGYQVAVKDVFLMYLSCIFLNNLIPSGSFSGETARIYFMEKIAAGSSLDKSSATVAATRMITAIPFIAGTVLGMGYLILFADVPTWALAACSAITVVLVGINAIFVGICFSSTWLEGIIVTILHWVERGFHVKVDRQICLGIVKEFHRSMTAFTDHRRTIAVSTLWAFAAWLSMNLVAFVTFQSMGVKVSIGAIFAVYAVMIFLQMLPLVLPGGIGLVDIVMITLFAAVGVPQPAAVAATILSRLIQLWFLTVAGGLATAYLLKKIERQDPNLRRRGTAD
ncbi:MAG: hypothetical protein A4E45_01996 [Methanosaeta sp. PtaB.Bin039]|nr:MAG: hypothetical protein A4E45_01996 [Methanosaeta sp. PtaB.Bin039]HOT06521.1 flippase-like domain-containing protein [Methanotrichaceae archaeon]HQF15606.1 flippase-like domain-containing protein [Methanotrichaceae archaeon]HQI90342.1 flippase-like domain-containing protein [Methanotrichaceae archaeon]HQJ28584.1 flippase-like domain-containing protein [Methanotrichaceae archaeon]